MRLSFALSVFILLGLLILPACAEAETPLAPTPTVTVTPPPAAAPLPAVPPTAVKTLRFIEFYSPL